ncbi:hypothetical protein [Actinoplanes sp. NPDC051494]|uniref:hypothetical protein n=1 Tax=Actinoplanes sp. NPDC051494 TaxID=3363907 RepID=UPI0037B01AC6
MTSTATARHVLDLPLPANDAGAATVRDYLIALLAELWNEEAGFSSKAPFGNSGWQYDLYPPLVLDGLVAGRFDEDGELEDDFEPASADVLILAAMAELGWVPS